MILKKIRKTSTSGSFNHYHLKCPVCGKEFYRDVRNYNKGVLKDCCCRSCKDKHNEVNGFDFQQAYNVAYGNWRVQTEEPWIPFTKQQQQDIKEVLCGG